MDFEKSGSITIYQCTIMFERIQLYIDNIIDLIAIASH